MIDIIVAVIRTLPVFIPFVLYWLIRKGLDAQERSDRAKRGWVTRRERYNYRPKAPKGVYNRTGKARKPVYTLVTKDIKVRDMDGSTFTIKR